MKQPTAMEIIPPRYNEKLVVCTAVVPLGVAAFSCCVAAEFKKVKMKNMKLDGSLCSLPRSCSFGLGITAIVCLSVAQIIGTTRAGARFCSTHSRSRISPILLLLACWITYSLALVLLVTASSMNGGQSYGKGWMDGDCYLVRDGVYAGAGVLVVSVTLLVLLFNFTQLDVDVPPAKYRRPSGPLWEAATGGSHDTSTS